MNTQIRLDQVRVASPCHARWEDMAGDDRSRFCGQCSKNVFNLSAMTRAQIETLIREKEGKFCGRFYRRPDGRMITADCPTGQRRCQERLARWGGAIFATVMLLFGVRPMVRAQEKNQPGVTKGQPTRLMGEVSVSPAIMGKIAVPPSAATNTVGGLTNCPAPDPGRVIMGLVALPSQTNRTSQPGPSK